METRGIFEARALGSNSTTSCLVTPQGGTMKCIHMPLQRSSVNIREYICTILTLKIIHISAAPFKLPVTL